MRNRWSNLLFAIFNPKSALALVSGCVIGWTAYVTWLEPHQDKSHVYRRFAEEIRRRTDLPVIFFRVEAHELAFHVGPPMDTILEWENLEVWATQADPVYIIMPPECLEDWPKHLDKGRLEPVLWTTQFSAESRDRPLVLARSIVPSSVPSAGSVAAQAPSLYNLAVWSTRRVPPSLPLP